MGTTTYLPPYAHEARQGAEVDLSQIPAPIIGGAGAAAMLSGLFWMLATGRLYTRSQHQEIVDSVEKRVADKDAQVVIWRAVGETSQAQMSELLEHSRLSVQLLQGIAAQAKRAESQ